MPLTFCFLSLHFVRLLTFCLVKKKCNFYVCQQKIAMRSHFSNFVEIWWWDPFDHILLKKKIYKIYSITIWRFKIHLKMPVVVLNRIWVAPNRFALQFFKKWFTWFAFGFSYSCIQKKITRCANKHLLKITKLFPATYILYQRKTQAFPIRTRLSFTTDFHHHLWTHLNTRWTDI